MDFDLSDDQIALQEGARDLLDGLAAPARVRAHTASGAAFDASLWAAMADQGWLGIEVPEARGGDARDRLLDRGATFAAADLLGSASRALDLAVEHAKERVQFGRPIGSFQAVKHRCADMLVDVEGMRSTVYWAAWCIGAADPEASIAASTAKTWCSDASKRVMSSALQVHGGVGFTGEHDLHLYLKRAQLDQVSFGDAAFHRQRLADLLRPRVEAGESVI